MPLNGAKRHHSGEGRKIRNPINPKFRFGWDEIPNSEFLIPNPKTCYSSRFSRI